MQQGTTHAIEILSKEFSLSDDAVVREGLKYFLEKKMRELKTEIYRIRGKYNISSVEELEDLFKKGQVEEKDALTDFQRLDHLEFKKEEIEKLIAEVQ
jgi:hypothetical protein